MNEIILLRPLWLAALPVLSAIAFWIWRHSPGAGGWERTMPPIMLAAMQALDQFSSGNRRTGLIAFACACFLVLGLSGPAIPRQDMPLIAGSGDIVLVIDMSPSVASSPELADAQAAAAEVLASAAGRPTGLIVFSGEAYEVSAPTSDPASLETQIAVLGPRTMPSDGKRPATALGLARQMLEGTRDAYVVLISDGGGIDDVTRSEASRLKSAGVRLFALTLTAAAGGTSDLRALETLGSASASARSPSPIIGRLSNAGASARDDTLAALRYVDLGPLGAALALPPLLVMFRRLT